MVIKSSRQKAELFAGKTHAYRRFRESTWRTQQLLRAGIFGLEEKSKEVGDLFKKFSEVKARLGRRPKGHKPDIQVKKQGESIQLRMDDRSAIFLRQVVDHYRSLEGGTLLISWTKFRLDLRSPEGRDSYLAVESESQAFAFDIQCL